MQSESAQLSVRSNSETTDTSFGWQPSDTVASILLGALLLQYIVFVSLAFLSKGFWIDELYTYYTARVDSVGKLIHVQIGSPLGIEPPLYPMLAHAFLHSFPDLHKIIRLPAAVGFFLLILCTFFFLKRLGGAKLALLATALLLASPSLYYASEARPYGLTFGLWGATLLLWQTSRHSKRWLPLFGLSAAIALAINTHYFSILMPVPIVLAELAGFRRRDSSSLRVLFAIAIGYSSALLWLPFLKGASQYNKNYLAAFKRSQLTNSYRYLLSWLPISDHLREAASVLAILFVCFGLFLLIRRGVFRDPERSPEWTALCISCLLPFLGAALAYAVHGTLETRYVLYALTGFCALAAVGMGEFVHRSSGLFLALSLVVAMACAEEAHVIREDREGARLEAQPIPSTSPGETVVIADFGKFLGMEAESQVSPSLAYVYDRKQEQKYLNTEYMTLTASNTTKFTDLPIYDADSFIKSHPAFAVAAWKQFDSWWIHSWNDENLKITHVTKNGSWTIYHVAVRTALQVPPASGDSLPQR